MCITGFASVAVATEIDDVRRIFGGGPLNSSTYVAEFRGLLEFRAPPQIVFAIPSKRRLNSRQRILEFRFWG